MVGIEHELNTLIDLARQASRRGDPPHAEQLLGRAQSMAPEHPLVLNERAIRLLEAGAVSDAAVILETLVRTHATFAEAWYKLGIARRRLNRLGSAIAALDCALALAPAHFPTLIEKASLLEQMDRGRAAATVYFAALQVLPPGWRRLPREQLERVQYAADVVDNNHRALEAVIADALGPLRARCQNLSLKRFDRCVAALLRKNRIAAQQPTFLHFPELPAIEFHDREHFPWLADIEAGTDAIRAELMEILGEGGAQALAPYNAAPQAISAAAQERQWRSYPFWREGAAFPEHMARCPRTMNLLNACSLWDPPGLGPNAMFSVLEGGARIPAHTGPSNTRLVAHLALIVPNGCGFRVGGESREWRPGEAFVFDDTIEHEAWNMSDELRALLIIDVWVPALSEEERNLVRALSSCVCAYYRVQAEPPAQRVR